MSGGSVTTIVSAQSRAGMFGTLGWYVRLEGVVYAQANGVEVLEVVEKVETKQVVLQASSSAGEQTLRSLAQRGASVEVGYAARLDDASARQVALMSGVIAESQVRETSERRRRLYEVRLESESAVGPDGWDGRFSIVMLETADENVGYGMLVERLESASAGAGAVRVVQPVERVKEGVFRLVPGWLDDGRSGEAASEYNRSTSSGDFAAVADVFRTWVLNEDGAYSGTEYGSQLMFDVRAFFDDPMEVAEARAFSGLEGDGSWTDGAMRMRLMYRLSVVDAWADWNVAYAVMRDRAGVVITGEMAGDVIDAAQAGTLEVRIEAGLPAAKRDERFRVVGNALRMAAGIVGEKVLSPVIMRVDGAADEGEVDAKIAAALSAGVATVHDGAGSVGPLVSVRVRLFPIDPSLRAGMRIVRVAGDGWDTVLPIGSAGCGSLAVKGVRHLLGEVQATELEVVSEVIGQG